MSYTHNGNKYSVEQVNGRYAVYVESNGKKMQLASSANYKSACNKLAQHDRGAR